MSKTDGYCTQEQAILKSFNHQFVIKCRVERAKELLIKSDLSIADITYQVGFANQGHLTNHFKRLLGVTPKVIRGK